VIIDGVLANPDRDYHRRRRFCLGKKVQGAMSTRRRGPQSGLRESAGPWIGTPALLLRRSVDLSHPGLNGNGLLTIFIDYKHHALT
jgi:hypothetical protein